MTTFAHRLPVEVWLNVFDQIQDKKQLIQCKLVCKRWQPLVEKVLLKTVVLMNTTNMSSLYQYLLEHPSSSRYIQEIVISRWAYYHLPATPTTFLSMMMTPSLKAIVFADPHTKGFIHTLVDIAAQKSPGYLKLEHIPRTTFENEAYDSLVYQLRETLRSLRLEFFPESNLNSIRHITNNFSQFRNLTDLRVADKIMYLNGIPQVDDMLKGCPKLESLTLDIDLSQSRSHYHGNLDTWLLQTVQQVNSLNKITIFNTFFRSGEDQDASTFGLFHLDLLQYLSFKYPNVELFEMEKYEQRNQPILRPFFDIARTIKLQNCKIDSIRHVQDMINIWKSKSNSITIYYSNRVSVGSYICDMSTTKEVNHTKFAFAWNSWGVPVERMRQLMLPLSRTLTKDFEICLLDYEENNIQHIGPLSFLQFTPFIERLKVKSKTLGQELLPLSPLTQLQSLILEGIDLTAKNVTDIASWAPHLKHLTLTHCPFTTGRLGSFDTLGQDITLPELALDTLTMNGFMSNRDLRISLATANSEPQLFYYAAPSRSIVRTTLKESELYANAFTSIRIECKSLKHLSVRLSRSGVEMEFDEMGNVIESKPAIEKPGIKPSCHLM